MSHPVATTPRETRQELLDVIDRLIAHFPDRPAGLVIAETVRAHERVRRNAGTPRRTQQELIAAVEHEARDRLVTTRPKSSRAADDFAALRADAPRWRWVAIDPRPYRHRIGRFLVLNRVTLAGTWTPLVTLRVRRPRAAEGGTEI